MKYLKFSDAVDASSAGRKLRKSSNFDHKVVIVNGFNGSGKTLFSPLVSSIQNVELMTFAYEVEWCAGFLYSNQMDNEAFAEFVKMYVDHLAYNQMMSRGVNFRPSDLSSALSYRPQWTYLLRLFHRGDNAIPKMIKERRPVLSITTCHLMPVFPALSTALGRRLMFMEIVRDPIYMFQQLLILHKTVIGPKLEKDFTLRSVSDRIDATYLDFYSSEDAYDVIRRGDPIEIVIAYLERVFRFYFELDFQELVSLDAGFMLVPFEKFVLDPSPWLEDIVRFTGSTWTKSINKEMKRQKVPRKLLRAGRNLAVYRRFGWSDNETGNVMTLKDEDADYREQIRGLINNDELYTRLEKLSDSYKEWSEECPRIVSI